MKEVNLILQSKGGVGKSLFMWFVAQHEKETDTTFIDLDESTETSSKRLNEVVGEKRIKAFKILNENKKLEREKILNLFETLSATKPKKIFIDLGAPESEEFKKLLQYDITAKDLASELNEIGVNLNLYVVFAGKDAFNSCLNYYNDLRQAIDNNINLIALMNEGTFGGIEAIDRGYKLFNELKIEILPFGGLPESESSKSVIGLIGNGSNPASLNFAGRMTYKKAMRQIETILSKSELKEHAG